MNRTLFFSVLTLALVACSGQSGQRADTMCRIVRGVRAACAAVDAYAPSCEAPTGAERDNEDMDQKPTVGRAVHYHDAEQHQRVDAQGVPLGPAGSAIMYTRPSEPRAAVIVRVSPKGPVSLRVFAHDTGTVDRTLVGVEFSAEPKGGAWSWPSLVALVKPDAIVEDRVAAREAASQRQREQRELDAATAAELDVPTKSATKSGAKAKSSTKAKR